jgi:hypothetical protein
MNQHGTGICPPGGRGPGPSAGRAVVGCVIALPLLASAVNLTIDEIVDNRFNEKFDEIVTAVRQRIHSHRT